MFPRCYVEFLVDDEERAERRVGERARLEFEPFTFPHGGVGCMEALIVAFDFCVTDVDDGT